MSTYYYVASMKYTFRIIYIYIIFFYLFIFFWLRWVFIAACGPSLVAVHRLLIVAASLVAELRLYSLQAMVVAATGL